MSLISEEFLKFYKTCNSQQQIVLAVLLDPEVLRELILFYEKKK